MIRRLRIKFVCINMAIVVLMLCLILGTVLHFTQRNAERESIRMMQAAALAPHPPELPNAPTGRMRLPCFTVRQLPDGSLSASGSDFFDLTGQDTLAELYAKASASDALTGILPDHGLRYLRVGTPEGSCIVFADITNEQATQRGLLRSCLLIGGAGTAGFFVISVLLSFWAVIPVESAWKQQRQFVSDASHELKTPLTVILTNAELLHDHSAPQAAREQFVDNILVMSRQMRALIENLLDLARIDNGATRQTVGTVDLSHVTASALLPFEPVYFEKGLTLSERVEEGILIRGSEARLKQVVEIFLDNAQKYAAPQGEIAVTLKRSGKGHCLLSVANPGETLSPRQLRDIFKRFYRADEARSRDGSYGLGLSIAEAVVKQHCGRVWAESTNGVNTFFVSFPTLPRDETVSK